MEMNKSRAPASETLQTADLDNQGILQLQESSMRQQDAELEELERTVTSTKVGSPYMYSAMVAQLVASTCGQHIKSKSM